MAKSGKQSGKAEQHAARQERLVAALRENLKRRKQQARQRNAARQPGEAEPGVRSEPDKPHKC